MEVGLTPGNHIDACVCKYYSITIMVLYVIYIELMVHYGINYYVCVN
jgi:hypothetical protein